MAGKPYFEEPQLCGSIPTSQNQAVSVAISPATADLAIILRVNQHTLFHNDSFAFAVLDDTALEQFKALLATAETEKSELLRQRAAAPGN